MNIVKKLVDLFTKKQVRPAPLIIIKKDKAEGNVMEYKSIDDAIADLEKDPNVSSAKIENLKSSLKQLKNKTSIKIRNGDILL